MTAASRILVIRLGSMGDVIHALPAVASLKRSFPNASVDWVIRPRWAPLLEGNAALTGKPLVDTVIPFDRSLGGLRESLRRLRRERYGFAVDFQGLIQSALVARAARVEKIIGLDRSRARESLASLFYSTSVRTTAVHRVDTCLELAAAAGATTLVQEFPLPEGRPEGSLPEGRFVLACPLAGWQSKQWPLESYEDVVLALQQDFGVPLVVNGPPESAGLLARIQGARIHLSGLSGLMDATRRASAIIGVDSGPLHLAAALRKPGVAIYGPTDPESHGPYHAATYGMRVLRAANAATSYKRRTQIDPSMRAIEPAMVYEALAAVLAEQATGKRP
jgi:heptosyltransferase-1